MPLVVITKVLPLSAFVTIRLFLSVFHRFVLLRVIILVKNTNITKYYK
jgi:hypothetical protein